MAKKVIDLMDLLGCYAVEVSAHSWALVSVADVPYVQEYNWHLYDGYAGRNIRIENKRACELMHRKILGISRDSKLQVDHINCNRLDNRRENLRAATHGQNQQNSTKYKSNTSGHKGVHYRKESGKWRARIQVEGKRLHLGDFVSKMGAAEAYRLAAIKHHKEFSRW